MRFPPVNRETRRGGLGLEARGLGRVVGLGLAIVLAGCAAGAGESDISKDILETAEPVDVPVELELVAPKDVPRDEIAQDLFAVDPGSEAEVVPYLPPLPSAPGVIVEVQSEIPVLPVPWDWFTVDDPSSPTGQRLSFVGPRQDSVLTFPLLDMFTSYRTEASALDGYGASGLIMVPINVEMDPASLPPITGPGLALELLEVGAEPGGHGPQCQVSYRELEDEGEVLRYLEFAPEAPLVERTSYLLVVRRSLTDIDEVAFEPYPLMRVVLGLDEPYGPPEVVDAAVRMREATLAALEATPGAPAVDDLAAAILFTVGTMTADMLVAADMLLDEEVGYDLDPDEDGVPNVVSAEEFFGSPQAGLSAVVSGRFLAPQFLNEDGLVIANEEGDMVVTGFEWREFFLIVPDAPDKAPYPVGLFQHGINSWKETEYSIARELAAQGVAAAVFDFIYHGKGNESSGFYFLQIDKPTITAGNFRQSVLDTLSFRLALKLMAEEQDLYPLGGDGLPDFDFSAFLFAGHSLGALVTSMACALSPDARIGGFVSGGGNFRFLLVDTLKAVGLYDFIPPDVMLGFRLLSGHLIGAADPVNYGPLLVHDPVAGRGSCPFLLQVGLKDETIPSKCGRALAGAARSPLIKPVLEEWAELDAVPAAGLTYGTVQFAGGHEFFNGGEGPEEKARARGLFLHFVTSYIETGVPEIIWP